MRIAIITGATGGLGMGFVQAIAAMDEIDEIWAVGRNARKLSELKDAFEKVVPVEADLAKDGISFLEEQIKEKTPDVRYLVNNAGIGYFGAFEKMKREEVKAFCRINCSVPAELIAATLPFMQNGARILNISSASSFQPNPYLSVYSASKVFLKNLSRAVGVELKPRGINVTCVCPGWVDTGMLPRTKDGKEINYGGMISVEQVVKKALKDSMRGKDMSVPGLFAKYFRIYSKVMPTGLIMRQWTWSVRKYL